MSANDVKIDSDDFKSLLQGLIKSHKKKIDNLEKLIDGIDQISSIKDEKTKDYILEAIYEQANRDTAFYLDRFNINEKIITLTERIVDKLTDNLITSNNEIASSTKEISLENTVNNNHNKLEL